jgi:hypothetical protein
VKTNSGKAPKLLLIAIQTTFYLFGILASASSQICSDPANIIYGLSSSGRIYPITVSNANRGTDINITNPSGGDNANALGFTSINNGKFYYYLKNPSGGNAGQFVSYDPVADQYEKLSEMNGPTENVFRASITSDGKYYCIDKNSNFYCYTIATDTWRLITSNFVDQSGVDVDVIFRQNLSGDMAFDGDGNLWFVVSGNNTIGLYKIPGPITSSSISSMSVIKILPVTTSTPDGQGAYGIAFNQTGEIYISTQDHLYLFNPNTLSFTLKGNLSGITDLTSCNFPMNVMPVSWISFNAEKNNKEQVYLSWEIINLGNNKEFHVQYSRDQINWEDLSVIKAQVGAKGTEKYSFTTWGIAGHENYYRIKQVDADNKFSYSWIRTIKGTDKQSINIFPNPARSFVTISSASLVKNKGYILDLSGRVIQSFELKPGDNIIDINNLNKGIYFLSVKKENGDSNMVRLIKQ